LKTEDRLRCGLTVADLDGSAGSAAFADDASITVERKAENLMMKRRR